MKQGNVGGVPSDSTGVNKYQKPIDPDVIAEKYAKLKNISVEEAKQELKTKFGDPETKKPLLEFKKNPPPADTYYSIGVGTGADANDPNKLKQLAEKTAKELGISYDNAVELLNEIEKNSKEIHKKN